jgi:hypothetical protein
MFFILMKNNAEKTKELLVEILSKDYEFESG